jgi:TctA family transporter
MSKCVTKVSKESIKVQTVTKVFSLFFLPITSITKDGVAKLVTKECGHITLAM